MPSFRRPAKRERRNPGNKKQTCLLNLDSVVASRNGLTSIEEHLWHNTVSEGSYYKIFPFKIMLPGGGSARRALGEVFIRI
jgi:hypothetical protein